MRRSLVFTRLGLGLAGLVGLAGCNSDPTEAEPTPANVEPPIDALAPAKPAKPTEPAKPAEPAKPVEPAQPGGPAPSPAEPEPPPAEPAPKAAKPSPSRTPSVRTIDCVRDCTKSNPIAEFSAAEARSDCEATCAK